MRCRSRAQRCQLSVDTHNIISAYITKYGRCVVKASGRNISKAIRCVLSILGRVEVIEMVFYDCRLRHRQTGVRRWVTEVDILLESKIELKSGTKIILSR